MMGDDDVGDIDLSLSPVRRSARPQKGRRATASSHQVQPPPSPPPAAAELTPSSGGDLLFESRQQQDGESKKLFGRRRSRPPGGWAEDSGGPTTAAAPTPATSTSRRPSAGFGQAGSDDDDEGPVIPDLDEVKDEDMALTVADAPSVAVNRVATYKELDNDLLKHVAFATLDGDIDLRLLTRSMAPESALKESDEPWHWDQVFAQVSGELRREWFPDDEDNLEVGEDQAGGSRVTKDRPYTAFNRFPV